MNVHIQNFLSFLEKEDDLDYGDFKREVDLHLMRLIDDLRPLTREQQFRLTKLREELLWMYNDDIEEMRAHLSEQVRVLDLPRPSDAPFQV